MAKKNEQGVAKVDTMEPKVVESKNKMTREGVSVEVKDGVTKVVGPNSDRGPRV